MTGLELWIFNVRSDHSTYYATANALSKFVYAFKTLMRGIWMSNERFDWLLQRLVNKCISDSKR